MYKEPANSPFVPKIQKDINTARYQERKRKEDKMVKMPVGASTADKPLVDLQVYQPVIPKPKRPVNPASFVPPFNPGLGMPPQWQQPIYANPLFAQTGNMYQQNQVPILKNYNITVGGPSTNHGKVNTIYEDILPNKQFENTSNTLGERLNIYQYVRSIFLRQGDGEDIDIDGKGDNSLLKYLKFMELNPYNPNQLSNNPYKGLPLNMLIYRSCYPIRYDRYSNSTQCAPNSVGMNIRIYRLTKEEYMNRKQNNTDSNKFDVWREIDYYQYVREQIVKKKVCPNFSVLHAYYICERCNIDFDKLAMIRGVGVTTNPKFNVKTCTEPIQQLQCGGNNSNLQQQQQQQSRPLLQQRVRVPEQQTKHRFQQNINGASMGCEGTNQANMYSGKALVALTEAPTDGMINWARATRKINGTIQKMVNTGFHKAEVWFSVLFQIMAALYTMQIHEIAFQDFSVIDNIYIKDTTLHENVTRYWKYIINGVEYYVPNYGYLVLIDSNYKDVQNGHKIKGKIFGEDVGDMPMNAFLKVFDPNAFSNAFTNNGGIAPSEEVITMLNGIKTRASDIRSTQKKDIDYYIKEFMTRFMNNRVGTLLKEDEISNIQQSATKDFRQGQVVVYEYNHESYKFVLYLGRTNTNDARVITAENPRTWHDTQKNRMIQSTVPFSSLFVYSLYEPIAQTYKPNEANLSEEQMLEVYVINKK